MKKEKTDFEKFQRILLKLHKYHNFRESHIKICNRCKSYYSLYNLLIADNFGNAEELNTSSPIVYKGELYEIGNRRNSELELFKDKKFIMTININEIDK